MDDNTVPKNAQEARDKTFCLYLNEHYGKNEIEDTVRAILKVEQAFVS